MEHRNRRRKAGGSELPAARLDDRERDGISVVSLPPDASEADAATPIPLIPDNPSLITGSLDGQTLRTTPTDLAIGSHQLTASGSRRAAVVWVGPQLDRLAQPGPGNHRNVFVNWY